jgi:hypothetical protein
MLSLWQKANAMEGYELNQDAFAPFAATLEADYEYSHKKDAVKNKMLFTDVEALEALKRDSANDFLFTDKNSVGANEDASEITPEQMVAMTGPELFALAAKVKQ